MAETGYEELPGVDHDAIQATNVDGLNGDGDKKSNTNESNNQVMPRSPSRDHVSGSQYLSKAISGRGKVLH